MRSHLIRRSLLVAAFTGLVAGSALLLRGARARDVDTAKPDKAAVERARETVKMLDDVYKGFVVNITEMYVKAREKTPAARVAKRVFKYMASKNWHSGRLVDATGEPINRANLPENDFEKRAIAKMKAGSEYYDEVAVSKGKPVLRAATRVPVVMKACITCHPGKKEGDLLGALVYEVPIK
jgi:hypothetical protein